MLRLSFFNFYLPLLGRLRWRFVIYQQCGDRWVALRVRINHTLQNLCHVYFSINFIHEFGLCSLNCCIGVEVISTSCVSEFSDQEIGLQMEGTSRRR